VNKFVLDAAAFLAYLRDEPGAEIVENAKYFLTTEHLELHSNQ